MPPRELALAHNIVLIYVLWMTTGELMRKSRLKKKKLQRHIAEELGCTQPTVHAWETDQSHPRVEQVRAVARAYGLRPEQLIPAEAA